MYYMVGVGDSAECKELISLVEDYQLNYLELLDWVESNARLLEPIQPDEATADLMTTWRENGRDRRHKIKTLHQLNGAEYTNPCTLYNV